MKILIVDDDPAIHLIYSKFIVEMGFEVFSAYDGHEAIDKVFEHNPDIIILDLTMPDSDGRDVCQQLKESPETKHIKIIMLTAKHTQNDRRLGMELGADEFITKPCSITTLEMTINRVVRKM